MFDSVKDVINMKHAIKPKTSEEDQLLDVMNEFKEKGGYQFTMKNDENEEELVSFKLII